MRETVPLLSSPSNSVVHAVRTFLILLSLLFSFPYAASQIAVYDVLYDAACGYYSVPADKCMNSPEATQFISNLLANVSIINAVVATTVLVFATILSDRPGGRERGLIWFMALSTAGVASFPLCAYGFSKSTSPWRMLVPYFFQALSGTPTLLLNLSMLHITDLVSEPSTRTKSLSLLIGFAMLVQAFAPGIGGSVLKTGIPLSIYMGICGAWMVIGTVIFAFNLKPAPKADVVEETGNASDNANTVPLPTTDMTGGLLHTLGIYDFFSVMKSRNAIIVALNFVLSNELAVGILDLIMVYAKHNFGWAGPTIGQNTFMLYSVRTAWALVGFPLVYSRLTEIWPAHSTEVDRADLTHMILCNVLTVAAYTTMATAKSSAQYSFGILVLANDGIVGTVWINSLIKQVPPDRKGAFMGALSLVNKPAGAILPALLMKVLQWTTESSPNTVFWIIVSVSLVLTVSLVFIKTSKPVILS